MPIKKAAVKNDLKYILTLVVEIIFGLNVVNFSSMEDAITTELGPEECV